MPPRNPRRRRNPYRDNSRTFATGDAPPEPAAMLYSDDTVMVYADDTTMRYTT